MQLFSKFISGDAYICWW